jgi:hypothetical protein
VKRLTPLAVLSIILLPAFAYGSSDNAFIVVPNVRFWGADITVGYRGLRLVPGVETTLWAHVGGGWESFSLYRDFAPEPILGVPLSGGDPRADYWTLGLDWQVGLAQGLLWSDVLERNLVEVMLQSRWRVASHRQNEEGTSSLLLASALPDREGLFMSTLLLGFHLDGVMTQRRRNTHTGLDAEVSAEWAPKGLLGSSADFVRLNAHVAGLVTLAEGDHVALVAGDRLEGDLLISPTGDLTTLPVWARMTLGGINPDGFGGESGLGGAVRGVHGGRFDGTLKIVNNAELRLLFPDLLPVAIVPGLIFFVDAGVSDYRTLDRVPAGLVLSAGAGLDLRLLVADLVLYGSYCLAPVEAQGFKVDFRFSTQF